MKPFLPRLTSRFPVVAFWLILELCTLFLNSNSAAFSNPNRLSENKLSVYQIEPEQLGGKAYKLTYPVQVPIDVYWKFKTDFDNNFLVRNNYIREHHFISCSGDTAITEDKYANAPDVFFRWPTTVLQEAYKLEFVLLNPGQCGQKFHYGSIQLESVAEGTRVTQMAYFDFGGGLTLR